MPYVVYLGIGLPLMGFLLIMSLSQSISRFMTHVIACSTIGISFICFTAQLLFYLNSGMQAEQLTLFTWIPLEKIQADVTLYVDSLSLLMTLIITGVGFLIHLYSTGYMDHEEDFARYFALLNFFVFCMLLLVLAGHLVVLFVGWEGVGLASYLLIGFWYNRPEAAKAATKAFVINRIGDLGLLIGLLLTFYLFGTSDIQEVSKKATEYFAVGAPIITVLTLLYFVGAIGKSAQLPLYSWLPDAMEGPTPVSALIHAATMVTAGVYLVVRMEQVFLLAPFTLQVIGVVGGVTSLFAALCALAQTDLKKVLAFSTVSQLGLMFLACGAGAFYSAMFHLTTHAFIKALLFLSAGNIVHLLQGKTEMSQMGGLSKPFPKTSALFLLGSLALAGLPPFAAFFSKDLILEQEYLSHHEFLFYIGLAASILTGVYLIRAYCLTFRGKTHLPEQEFLALHEASLKMIFPISILALLATFGGLLGFTFYQSPLLQSFLKEIKLTSYEAELRSGFILTPETWVTVLGSLTGIILTAWVYTRYVNRLGPVLTFLKKAFYLNEIYDFIFVVPLATLAKSITQFFEPKIFEGVIQGSVFLAQESAGQLQKIQNGQIRSYLAWIVLGSTFLLAYLIF